MRKAWNKYKETEIFNNKVKENSMSMARLEGGSLNSYIDKSY